MDEGGKNKEGNQMGKTLNRMEWIDSNTDANTTLFFVLSKTELFNW